MLNQISTSVTVLRSQGSLQPAIICSVLSWTMILLNKLVVTKHYFDFPVVIMMFQTAICLLIIEILRVVGVLKLQPYSFERGKDMFLPSLFWCLHTWFALSALEGLSLPMYGTVKRCAPIVLVVLATVFLRRPIPTRQMIVTLLILLVSTFIASYYDFLFDAWAYLWGAIAVGFQALYLTAMERVFTAKQYSALEVLYMNCFNGLVFFLIVDIIRDEIRDAYMYVLTASTYSFSFCTTLGLTLVLGNVLNYYQFKSLSQCSAQANTLAAGLKAIVGTIVGYFLSLWMFFDIVPDFWNIVGLATNVICAVVFGFLRDRHYDQHYNPTAVTKSADP